MNYRIFPPSRMVEASVELPLSKSVSNRALVIAALTSGASAPATVANCDDTKALSDGLKRRDGSVDIGRAGTAMRFLTAFYAATPGTDVTLTGDARMQERPIGPLVDALRHLGADIAYCEREGFPPLQIKGRTLPGKSVDIDGSVSSQFISALLLIAPALENGLTINLGDEDPVSLPYIDMTLAMMRRAGVEATRQGSRISVAPGAYVKTDLPTETDWSSAGYIYEVEALSSGFLTLTPPLDPDSIQGDRVAAKLFADLGVVTEFEGEEPDSTDLLASPDISPRMTIDLSDTPDLVPTLAVTCVMLRVPFRFSGLKTLRLKETDRVAALQTEMLKLGATITYGEEAPDTLAWNGVLMPVKELPQFATYADHRMAMALAPVAMYVPGIVVEDAEVVSKSFPAYWDMLRRIGFRLYDAEIPIEEVVRLEEEALADDE